MFRARLLYDDLLLRRIVALAVGLAVVHGMLFLLWGRGQVIVVLSWIAPLADGITALAALSVAFLAIGRYRVLREPAFFWIGIAFGTSAILDVYYLLSWPGLLTDDRGLIAKLPNTSGWLLGLKFSLPAIFLPVAVLSPWPKAGAGAEPWSWWLAAAIMVATALTGWLSVTFEQGLPLLVVDSSWTSLYTGWFLALLGAYLAGAVLSAQRYRQGGDTFLGYVALTQVALAFFFLSSIIGGERYDPWWYFRRILLIYGFTVILFGQLSEYVALYRREREKTRELEALQRVTDPALARQGLDRLLQNLLEQTISIMGARGGAFFILDPATRELVLSNAVGIPEERTAGLRVKVGEGFVGRVAARNAVLSMRDMQADPALRSADEENQVRGIVGAPMCVGEEVIGVVEVDFQTPREFTPHEERLLEVVAERSALTIHQQRLLGKAEHERQRLQVLVDTTPAGITFHRAPDGRLELFNKASEAILGRPMAPQVGVTGIVEYYEVFHPSGEPFLPNELPASRSLKGEVCVGVEMLIRQPSGREIYILTNSAPLRDSEGQIIGAVVAFQDITPIKEQERMREEFISAAAHELKTPVTTIKGYAQLMCVWAPGGHEPREGKAFEVINAQVDRLTHRVQEMLEVTRFRVDPPEMHKVHFDLGEVTARVVQEVQATVEHHRLVLEVDGPIGVKADRERIEQVLVSLLDNAIRYSPSGGDILVQVWAPEGEAMVSIKDQGVGISKERLAHVFEPFYEAVPPGATGYRGTVALSLYLSKLIIERHKGRIWLDSEEGKGSTFSFTLPLSETGNGGPA